jgi:hypothetical protein
MKNNKEEEKKIEKVIPSKVIPTNMAPPQVI